MLEKLEKLNVRERQEISGDVPTIENLIVIIWLKFRNVKVTQKVSNFAN